MKTLPPCYACETRFPCCHSQCDRYSEWKDRKEVEKAKARKAFLAERTHRDYVVSRKIAIKKRKGDR